MPTGGEITDVDTTTLPPRSEPGPSPGRGVRQSWRGIRRSRVRAERAPATDAGQAVKVTGISTTFCCDPSIALTSYTRIVPGCVEPTWYCTSIE
jgi:hypothetical protein